MKSTQQVKKTGFSASSGIKAGDCVGECFSDGDVAVGYECYQCPPERPDLLCTGNTSCNANGPAGDDCQCVRMFR